jgi:hypothetical protein
MGNSPETEVLDGFSGNLIHNGGLSIAMFDYATQQ